METVIFIAPLVFAIIAGWLWLKFGRDDKITETIEFYPPDGMNSLDVGFAYKGMAENKDVTSLLVYLANKGYIKITEVERTGVFSKNKKSFEITKLREYDGNNEMERAFFYGLFYGGSRIGETIREKDLYNEFYITMNEIIKSVNKNKYKIIQKSSSRIQKILIGLMILTLCLINAVPIIGTDNADILPIALIFPTIGFSLMYSMMFGTIGKKSLGSSKFKKVFGFIWGTLFGGIPWLISVLPALVDEPIYLIQFFIGIAGIIVMGICEKHMIVHQILI